MEALLFLILTKSAVISFQPGSSEIDYNLPSTEPTTIKISGHLNLKNK